MSREHRRIAGVLAVVAAAMVAGGAGGWALAVAEGADARIMIGPEWADARGQLRRSVYWSSGRPARGERLGDVMWVQGEHGARWVPGRRLLAATAGEAAVLGEGSLDKAVGTLAAHYGGSRSAVPAAVREMRALSAMLGSGLGGLLGLAISAAWHLGIRSGWAEERRR